MANIIELKTANYKGVDFLFEDMSTTGGNRIIKFNYPGSDKQSVERQGKIPRSFSIPIIIQHDNYYQRRDELLRVLEDGEKGVLVHPTFGDVENVISGQYTLEERVTELGRAVITVPFEIDDAIGIPQQSGNLASEVQELSLELNAELDSEIEDSYEVSLNATGNFNDAIDNGNNVADSFDQASDSFNENAAKLNEVKSEIDTFSSNIGSLIQAPQLLASNVSSLFNSLNNLYETPEQTLNALRGIFNFGDDDPIVNKNTVGRIERKRNRDVMKAVMRTQALSYAYVSAAEAEYQSTDELDNIQNELEEQYLDSRNNQLLSNESLESLDRLRVQAQKTLDDARVNTSTIITVEVDRKPLSVIVYNFYGNTDLVDVIAEINNIKQNAFVEGELRILTA